MRLNQSKRVCIYIYSPKVDYRAKVLLVVSLGSRTKAVSLDELDY